MSGTSSTTFDQYTYANPVASGTANTNNLRLATLNVTGTIESTSSNNWHGTNNFYGTVYESNVNINSGTATTLNISSANITTANIVTANVSTAYIATAHIATANVTSLLTTSAHSVTNNLTAGSAVVTNNLTAGSAVVTLNLTAGSAVVTANLTAGAIGMNNTGARSIALWGVAPRDGSAVVDLNVDALGAAESYSNGVYAKLTVPSNYGTTNLAGVSSAQSVRGRIIGSNITTTAVHMSGVRGDYRVTGSNDSRGVKAAVLGAIISTGNGADANQTADAAVLAFADGDSGISKAGAAFGVRMSNSTPGSGFDYGADLKIVNRYDPVDRDAPYGLADIRLNNNAVIKSYTTSLSNGAVSGLQNGSIVSSSNGNGAVFVAANGILNEIQTANSTVANLLTLNASTANVTGAMNALFANITTLNASTANVSTLNVTSVIFKNLTGTDIIAVNITAKNLYVDTIVNVQTENVTNGLDVYGGLSVFSGTLQAGYVNVTSASPFLSVTTGSLIAGGLNVSAGSAHLNALTTLNLTAGAIGMNNTGARSIELWGVAPRDGSAVVDMNVNASGAAESYSNGVYAKVTVPSGYGANNMQTEVSSAQSVRGRIIGANITTQAVHMSGVRGDYRVGGTNASRGVKAAVLGAIIATGDGAAGNASADAAVLAFADGDGGISKAGAAFGVRMSNSNAASGFDYGADLKIVNRYDAQDRDAPYGLADIRLNNSAVIKSYSTALNNSAVSGLPNGSIVSSSNGNGAVFVAANGILNEIQTANSTVANLLTLNVSTANFSVALNGPTANISTLNAATANITTLNASNANVSGTLTSLVANLASLNTSSANVTGTVTALHANISNLNATNANILNLNSTNAIVYANLTAGALRMTSVQSGSIIPSSVAISGLISREQNGIIDLNVNASGAASSYSNAVYAKVTVPSGYGSNNMQTEVSSVHSLRGRIIGENITTMAVHMAGVRGDYRIGGSNASLGLKAGVVGVIYSSESGAPNNTADAAVLAFADGDGGISKAGAAFGVRMSNSTAGSGFDYGADLKIVNRYDNGAPIDVPYAQADIRLNNSAGSVIKSYDIALYNTSSSTLPNGSLVLTSFGQGAAFIVINNALFQIAP